MPKVTFVLHEVRTTIDAYIGSTMMKTAVQEDVEGILGECGGNTMCGTCHVYVEDGPIWALPPISAAEEEMLNCTAAPRETNSRLACQLEIIPEVDGLVVRIADEQL